MEPIVAEIAVISGRGLGGDLGGAAGGDKTLLANGGPRLCPGRVHLQRYSGNGAVPGKAAVSRDLERDSSEEASLSTTTASPDLISVVNSSNHNNNNNNNIPDRTHFDRRKLRSASADRILENGASRSREVAESPSPVAQSWQSWGLERRRQWRRSLSGSQSLAHVGYSLQPVSGSQLRHSSDLLDRRGVTASTRARLDEVEAGLFIGSMEAATDIRNLELHGVTHIVTVDSVPLPRKITSLLPRLACLHIQVCDIPSEDLLTHFPAALSFVSAALASGGAVLVHCYRGVSRSAALVTAHLMARHGLDTEAALTLLKARRPCVRPNPGFMAQLRLWEAMRCKLVPEFLRYKMYRLHIVSEKIRKSKLLSREAAGAVLDPDPGKQGARLARDAAVVYKCKQCRRVLATCDNLVPHVSGHSPYWYSVAPRGSRGGQEQCTQTVSINPMAWMEDSLRSSLQGKLSCPHCRTKVGSFSWVLGHDCRCGANLAPAFVLDMTGLIFRTGGRHLDQAQQPREVARSRQPVVV